MKVPWPRTLEEFNQYGKGFLFGYLGMAFTKVEEDEEPYLLWRIRVPDTAALNRCRRVPLVLQRSKQRTIFLP